MKTVGIVVEYNPLHNGHVLHFQKSKAATCADAVVAVMSGPFLQRGEPAVASKRARTEMALAMGVDLVLELPVAYAVQPAEWFAFGAVATLHATGVVDSLSFGSESGSLSRILPLSRLLAGEADRLRPELSRRLAEGHSFPAAYGAAAAAAFGVSAEEAAELSELLSKPNNSLGLHYLIALHRLSSPIVPFTIRRESAQYHDPLPGPGSIASATAVRGKLGAEGLEAVAPYIPEYTRRILEREIRAGRAPMDWERFRQPLFHALLTAPPSRLARCLEVTEGLEHRIRRVLPRLERPDVHSLLDALKTKRYTRTKLQRMLLHIMLDHRKDEMSPASLAKGPGYIRVLGFSDTGRALLKTMKKTASLPIVVKPPAFEHPQLTRDLEAAAAYANGYPRPEAADLFGEYRLPPLTL